LVKLSQRVLRVRFSKHSVSVILQVHVLNPLCMHKMDLLAYLYSQEDQTAYPELEKSVLS